MNKTTACFTGHRTLPTALVRDITKRLDDEVESLIRQGVTDFISGGAIGFDQLAASLIVEKRMQGRPIRLILAIPCREQDKFWSESEKRIYRRLLTVADEVTYISEHYFNGCMQKRNRYMVGRSAHCIAYLTQSAGGTWGTARYAREQGLRIINVAH